jgi:hypothetical protein
MRPARRPFRWLVPSTGARLAGQAHRWLRPPPHQGAYPASSLLIFATRIAAVHLTRRFAHRIRHQPPRTGGLISRPQTMNGKRRREPCQ